MTSLDAGFPLGVEPVFDMSEHDSDSDYDVPVEDPTGDPDEVQPPIDVAPPILPERRVKVYIVKYTAYRTFVGDPRSLRRSLIDEIQPACDHLVYLYRRDHFLPQ